MNVSSGWNPHQKKIVNQILGDLNWLVSHNPLLGYRSYRPWEGPKRWPRPTHYWQNDCTGSIKEVVCDWNSVPVFDDEPLNYGDTQTFADSKSVYHVPGLSHAQPLDICLYNNGGPFVGGNEEHATILTHQHNNVWYAFSHGQESDPAYIQADQGPHGGAPKLIVRFPIPLR